MSLLCVPNYNAVIPPKDADGMTNSADTGHEHSDHSMNCLIKHFSNTYSVDGIWCFFTYCVKYWRSVYWCVIVKIN